MNTSLSKPEMQVTSIRFERELIEQLKAIAGKQGYQALVRDVLWDYVNHQSQTDVVDPAQIKTVVNAIATQAETCRITGQAIAPGEKHLLGLLHSNDWVPLCASAISP